MRILPENILYDFSRLRRYSSSGLYDGDGSGAFEDQLHVKWCPERMGNGG